MDDVKAASLLFCAIAVGCFHHQVAFEDIHNPLAVPKDDAGIVCVVDQATLDGTVDVHSWQGRKRIALVMTVPSYRFADFHATVTVHAVAYGPRRNVLFDKRYMQEGDTQGGKMAGGGAYAMKSAIRQSSYDAFKKIFLELRGDLGRALQSPDAEHADRSDDEAPRP